MEQELFSEELASISDLSDRWDVQLHQLTYVVRSRKIPYEKMAGTTRLFNTNQQKTIYAALHRYLPNEGNCTFAPPIPELSEEQAQQEEELMQAVEAIKAENVALEAELAEVKADVAILKRLVLREPTDRK